VNPRDRQLIDAARHGDAGAVRLALGGGADANVTDENGYTPLMWAVLSGNSTAVRALLDNPETDPDKRGSHGEHPLALAVALGHARTVWPYVGRKYQRGGTAVRAVLVPTAVAAKPVRRILGI